MLNTFCALAMMIFFPSAPPNDESHLLGFLVDTSCIWRGAAKSFVRHQMLMWLANKREANKQPAALLFLVLRSLTMSVH